MGISQCKSLLNTALYISIVDVSFTNIYGSPKSLVGKDSLVHIGTVKSPLDLVIQEGKRFVAKCYSMVQLSESLSRNRWNVWVSKTNGAKSPPSTKLPAKHTLFPLCGMELSCNWLPTKYLLYFT